jgi:hypothetical protein
MAGPGISTVAQGAAIGIENAWKAIKGKPTHAAAETINLVRQNAPYVNLWYAKAALDHAGMHALQENLSRAISARCSSARPRNGAAVLVGAGHRAAAPGAGHRKGGGAMRRNPAATLAIVTRVQALIHQTQQLGDTPPPLAEAGSPGQDGDRQLDDEILKAEREASNLMKKLQAGPEKVSRKAHGKA